jgi:uncharacterized protein (DUF1778 family)
MTMAGKTRDIHSKAAECVKDLRFNIEHRDAATSRIEIRASAPEVERIREAADKIGVPVAALVLQAALQAAEQILVGYEVHERDENEEIIP